MNGWMSGAAVLTTALLSCGAMCLRGSLEERIASLQLASTIGVLTLLNMVEMGRILAGKPPDGLVVAAFVLVAAGLLVKSAILPFHFAHADAHAVAPTPVLVIFSGILLYVGLYGLARTYWTVFTGTFAGETPALQLIFLYAGAATALSAG